MLSSASSVQKALEIRNQTIELLKKGGFKLKKWFSNKPSIRNDNSKDDKRFDLGTESDKTRALGVSWNCHRDTFNFINPYNHPSLIKRTKRNILARIALIFDPLGFLGPFLILGKLIMQELWLLKVDWDESIPMNLHTRWQNYEQQLNQFVRLQILRKSLSMTHILNCTDFRTPVNKPMVHAHIYDLCHAPVKSRFT